MSSAPGLADDLELLIRLDRTAARSLQRQLLDQLRHALLQGQIAPGRRLPATRVLAAALSVSRNLVEAVYDELAVQGYVARRHGSGTYAAADLPTQPPDPPPPTATAPPR